MNLDFLKDVKLEPVAKVAAKSKRVSVDTIPSDDMDIRVFANGKVFPSADFAKRYNLEFQPKIALEGQTELTEVIGNGLDIFSTQAWGMMAAARTAGALKEEFLCVAPVPKRLAKVDMWASTKYDENNQPKASVFTQGSNTFAKDQLVPMISEVYGVDWEATAYVDLKVAEDSVISSENGIYALPKIVSTGKDKGNPTYVRRENLTICPLVVAHVEASEPKAEKSKDIISEVKAEDTKKAVTKEVKEPETVSAGDPGEDWANKLGAK